MAEKQNTPEIRFEGFTDPWEQRKLGDCVGSTYGGGTPSTSHDEYWGGNIPWIQSSNVLENELFRIDIPKAITQDGLSKSAALRVPGDSIAVVTHVGVGKLVYLPFPYATSQDFVSLSELKGDANFLCYAIHRKLQSELHMVQGSAIKGITKEELLGKAIFLPAAEEQKLVGNQMRAIDNLITLHQRKYDKLCTVKKSMLDKMFPKPGETEPEIRFEGFTDPWEQRKLGNCGTTYGGLTGKTKEDFGHGNARFIPYTNVFDNPLTDTKRLGAVEIDSSQNQVAYGDAFFTVSSETPDEVGMSSVWLSDQEDVYLNSFCFGYRQDSTFDPHYLAYMLRSRSVRSNLTLLAQGISRFNISKNKVMELSVPVPSAVEQEQLGQYFTKLDSLITLHQREPPHTMKEGKNANRYQWRIAFLRLLLAMD